eukprot:14689580-Heterocapsa_arctica.AAC.1
MSRENDESEQPAIGVLVLRKVAAKDVLLLPATNMNDYMMKWEFDNVRGCRHSLPDGIVRAMDVITGGKRWERLDKSYGSLDGKRTRRTLAPSTQPRQGLE